MLILKVINLGLPNTQSAKCECNFEREMSTKQRPIFCNKPRNICFPYQMKFHSASTPAAYLRNPIIYTYVEYSGECPGKVVCFFFLLRTTLTFFSTFAKLIFPIGFLDFPRQPTVQHTRHVRVQYKRKSVEFWFILRRCYASKNSSSSRWKGNSMI